MKAFFAIFGEFCSSRDNYWFLSEDYPKKSTVCLVNIREQKVEILAFFLRQARQLDEFICSQVIANSVQDAQWKARVYSQFAFVFDVELHVILRAEIVNNLDNLFLWECHYQYGE